MTVMRHGGTKTRILLVHEDPGSAKQVSTRLEGTSYLVMELPFDTMAAALEAGEFDLVVLVGSSRPVLASLRSVTQAPILVIGPRADSRDVIAMLDGGADDFLPLQQDKAVFLAHLRALMRRSTRAPVPPPPAERPAVLKLGNLTVEPESHLVLCESRELALTRSEIRLLTALMRQPGESLSRDTLIAEVQGQGVKVVARTVDTQIHGLRRKLGGSAAVIETVRGKGYRIRADAD